MRCIIVIPSRMGSTRFPGKPLFNLAGKPMVQWVYEAAAGSGVANEVVVATPDDEIIEACKSFGARAVLTGHHHVTGTDRIVEVSRSLSAEVYVNVQGDEPLIEPASIRTCASLLLDSPAVEMGSVYSECPPQEYDLASVVKVVLDNSGFALYFSRWPIPFARNDRVGAVLKHVGLYAYRAETLDRFSRWQPTPLETAESLEQLRFMENGVRIKMAQAKGTELAVDTPEDAQRVDCLLRELNQTASPR